MAFDTENQRRAALNSAFRINFPVPDGSMDVGDRAMLLFQYAFSSFPSPIVVNSVIVEGNSIITNIVMGNSKITDLVEGESPIYNRD